MVKLISIYGSITKWFKRDKITKALNRGGTRMVYNLRNYRYKNGNIYQRVFWCFFKCIKKSNYKYMEGVKIVNKLAGFE